MIWATIKRIDAIRAKRNKPHFPWSFAWALGCQWRLKLLLAWPWNRGGLTLPACDLGNLFYIWGGMWCWEGPGKGWPKFLLTHKQPGQMQRNLLDLCLNWLRWFRDLEMQSVQNTGDFFRTALGMYRKQYMGWKEGVAYLTVNPEKQLLRSNRFWDIFPWLLARKKVFIKMREGSHVKNTLHDFVGHVVCHTHALCSQK